MNSDKFYKLKEEDKLQKLKLSILTKDQEKEVSIKETVKSFPLNKLDFNSLYKMKKLKINRELIKSSQEFNNEKEYIARIHMKKHKRIDGQSSVIIEDLKIAKNIIPQSRTFVFHNYIENGNVRLILNDYNKGQYFCILRYKNNYAIYGKNYYIYDNNDFKIMEKDFSICYQILSDEKFEIEIFSIV